MVTDQGFCTVCEKRDRVCTTCLNCSCEGQLCRHQKASLSGEVVDHPQHYGGKDNIYEAIKVIEAWDLGFHLGNAVKYICRAGKKHSQLEDLRKAHWYLSREIERLEKL